MLPETTRRVELIKNECQIHCAVVMSEMRKVKKLSLSDSKIDRVSENPEEIPQTLIRPRGEFLHQKLPKRWPLALHALLLAAASRLRLWCGQVL